MNTETRVNVSILDKEYQVACKPEERLALLAAARSLDSRMRKVRNSGGVIGADRIAVMVGLNLCYELSEAQNGAEGDVVHSNALNPLLDRLNQALDKS